MSQHKKPHLFFKEIPSKILSKKMDFEINAKLRGRGLCADNLCMIKIFVKAETSKSRSVAPDPLQRFVMNK
jgi:hypothetical protein